MKCRHGNELEECTDEGCWMLARSTEGAARVVDNKIDELINGVIKAAHDWGVNVHRFDDITEVRPQPLVDAEAALQEYIAEIRQPAAPVQHTPEADALLRESVTDYMNELKTASDPTRLGVARELELILGVIADAESLPRGPFPDCPDCGVKMIWSNPKHPCPTWMCPQCVLRRCHDAEAELRRIAKRSTAPVVQHTDAEQREPDGWVVDVDAKPRYLTIHLKREDAEAHAEVVSVGRVTVIPVYFHRPPSLTLTDEQCDAREKALREALAFFEHNAVMSSYGFSLPEDPRDFSPDAESCSEAEIEAHRLACEAWNTAGGKPEGWDAPDTGGWNADRTAHVLKAPWGIGVSTYTDPELCELRDVIRAALSASSPSPESEVSDA